MTRSWIRTVAAAAFALLSLAFAGCRSECVTIVFSGSTNVELLDITMAEGSKLPLVGYRTGPYFLAHTPKGYGGSVCFKGVCSITNTVSALGIYKSSEAKRLAFAALVSTNGVSAGTVELGGAPDAEPAPGKEQTEDRP